MSVESYFSDHWIDVSEERHAVYEQVLAWSPFWDLLYEPAEVAEGQVILDLGCGPGHMTMEMARRVGPAGRVHAVDINEEFLHRTRSKAIEAGFGDRVETHLTTDHVLPLPDSSIDRVLAKNVLEYVPNLGDTLGECFRVTTAGGRMTASDSDWDFLVVQPWSVDEQRRYFAAGSHAFKEPHIGRKLHGAMLDAGFVDVAVSVHPIVDDAGGRVLAVIENVAGYIAELDTMPLDEVNDMLGRLRQAVTDGRYLAVLPQFSVTGHKPST